MATPSSELIDEALRLDERRHAVSDAQRAGDVEHLAGRLAPDLARRLRAAEEELAEVRTALDVPAGDLCEAVEELQRLAARVPELQQLLDRVQAERDRLRCDLSRGQVS